MNGFIQFAKRLVELDERSEIELDNKLKTKTIKKGSLLLKQGEVCRHIYYIEKGLLKFHFNTADKEFVMRFFPEHSMFTVLNSFLEQKPSTYSILALETTTILYLDEADLDKLCKNHHRIETYFRKLVSLASINMMKRISEMLEENATDRYKTFVKENEALLQRISLGDLANYLGITQVSLSRIRAKK